MPNTKTIQLIQRAYDALDVLNEIKMGSHYRDQIFRMSLAGERRHRRGGGEYRCTAHIAAKLHVVRWLVDYATLVRKPPTVSDLLTLRDDVQLCAMVVATYRDLILQALRGFDLQQLVALDYVALIENRSDEAPQRILR